MVQNTSRELGNFNNHVGIKFQLYNSLFISLPFHRIEKTGILLSLFLNTCEEGYASGKSPTEIVYDFFSRYSDLKNDPDKMDLLLRFIQYVERQVVLFDALEESAFNQITDVSGVGSFKQIEIKVKQLNMQKEFESKLQEFNIALVLTAHPTQFYPASVLGIINDLSKALKENNANQVNIYLQQLGKTPLFKKEKPTPYDEAMNLIWYLENVFYNAAGNIITNIRNNFPNLSGENPLIKMGFWPGGDRDGNPNVTAAITLKVAAALRSSILKCYYLDVRKLKRRLTFAGIESILSDLESKLYDDIFIPESVKQLTAEQILEPLLSIRNIITKEHNGLFLSMLDNLINKVHVFGVHFATLDIRQESSIHGKVLDLISREETNALLTDTIESIKAVRTIQKLNGAKGCDRYIISQCNSAKNVMEVYQLFLVSGYKEQEINMDIVPLFETIDDLGNASSIMQTLYHDTKYVDHLNRRNRKQTIMLGFSDGTKDGGYLMANWSIFKAKEELTRISRENNIDVIFFDGRGGPPARGGGKTHKFYASMGRNISSKEIHLTIQGQTVSSSFGNVESAQYNIEQLLNAGLTNELFSDRQTTLTPAQQSMVQELSDVSLDSYRKLRDHPGFTSYLQDISPLNYFADTNISSRPASRKKSSTLSLKDLRAIPFVGAWSQIKQNVPGYYGLGTALQYMDQKGNFEEIIALYKSSQYFKTLLDNCEMSMEKSFFPLTQYLSSHPEYGPIWNLVHDEYKLTQKYLFKLSGNDELMQDYPVEKLSIQMRERIVLPLTTIQQFALSRLRDAGDIDAAETASLERLIVRSSFGIINAGRNSV